MSKEYTKKQLMEVRVREDGTLNGDDISYAIGNIINRSRFNHIIKYYNETQLKHIELNLNNTIDKIDVFKKEFKYEIYEDLYSKKTSNNHIKHLSNTIIAISVIDTVGYIIDKSYNIIKNTDDVFSHKNKLDILYIIMKDTKSL